VEEKANEGLNGVLLQKELKIAKFLLSWGEMLDQMQGTRGQVGWHKSIKLHSTADDLRSCGQSIEDRETQISLDRLAKHGVLQTPTVLLRGAMHSAAVRSMATKRGHHTSPIRHFVVPATPRLFRITRSSVAGVEANFILELALFGFCSSPPVHLFNLGASRRSTLRCALQSSPRRISPPCGRIVSFAIHQKRMATNPTIRHATGPPLSSSSFWSRYTSGAIFGWNRNRSSS
jgi:hypothetical protein